MRLKTSAKIGNKPNIGVITHAFSNPMPGEILLKNLINILEPLSNELFVITGTLHENMIFNKKIHIRNIKYVTKKEPTVIKIFRTLLMQLRISFNLIKISKNIDVVIFFLGMSLVLPMFFAKLLRKKTILIITSSFQRCAKMTYSKMLFGYGGFIFSGISRFLEKINYALSDQLIVDPQSIYMFGLQRYKNKIAYGPRHVNLEHFKVSKKIDERENIVGYIGRFSEEKGIRNFADAIPIILKECENVKILMGGDGLLYKEIKQKLGIYPPNKILFARWIPHEKLPEYLNELKLIAIPSYTETGPFIALEAMACGTPVLATSVGLIPDIVKDGETGFIMENNSPKCIAKDVIRALNYPGLDGIVNNARKLIEREYTYEAAVENYRKILEKV